MLEKIKEVLNLTNVPNEQLRMKKEKIEWDHIFLLEAKLWALKSHDPQTQCGCVLTKNKTVLSTGYNGFIRNINDEALPNLRPYKYNFMIHAEHNAILNCARSGVSTLGATAYITGMPCNNCLQYMWQAGIHRIVYSNFSNINMLKNEEFARIQQTLLIVMSSYIDFMELKFVNKSCITQKLFGQQLQNEDNI